jgi:hypothetical protein
MSGSFRSVPLGINVVKFRHNRSHWRQAKVRITIFSDGKGSVVEWQRRSGCPLLSNNAFFDLHASMVGNGPGKLNSAGDILGMRTIMPPLPEYMQEKHALMPGRCVYMNETQSHHVKRCRCCI